MKILSFDVGGTRLKYGEYVYDGKLKEICVNEIDTIAYQVERDRLTLSDLCGYEVVGMAYPNGAVDERVVKIINEKTKIKYARTVKPTDDFNLQSDLIVFNPTVY